jgi:hypothetical protein
VQAEAMNDQTLALSDQLQTGQIVEQETTVQAVTVSQIVVVDVPSDREVEEVGKTPDVKEDYLVREVEDIRNCGDLQQVVPFHHAQISWRKGLINEKIKKLALGFNMINLRRLVLVSGIALSAITFTPKAQAQTTQDVNFNGNISPAFTFSFGSGANPTPTTGFSGNSFQGTVNVSISCSTGAFISVSVPERIAAPLGFNDAFRKARVRLGNSFTSAEVGSSTGFPLWTNSAPAPLSIGGCTSEPLVVEMITGSTDVGSSPAGSYTYRVTLTATAQ